MPVGEVFVVVMFDHFFCVIIVFVGHIERTEWIVYIGLERVYIKTSTLLGIYRFRVLVFSRLTRSIDPNDKAVWLL